MHLFLNNSTSASETPAGQTGPEEGSSAASASASAPQGPSSASGGPETPPQDFARARVDIRHLQMSGLPFAEEPMVRGLPCAVVVTAGCALPSTLVPACQVGIAKHLCGVATDLALRALRTRCEPCTPATTANPGAEKPAHVDAMNVEDPAPHEGTKETVDGHADAAAVGDAEGKEAGDMFPGRGWKAGELGVRGVAVATCCHHCCDWKDFTGKGFFLYTLGLGEADFNRMKRWSGWACSPSKEPHRPAEDHANAANTSHDETLRTAQGPAPTRGTGGADGADDAVPDENDDEHQAPAGDVGSARDFVLCGDPERRCALGRMCKRLIDLGRLRYLQDLGMEAELIHYCPSQLSPENGLLLAWLGAGC